MPPDSFNKLEDSTPIGAAAQSLLKRLPGYALGGPLMIQEEPRGTDPSFLFQFSEALVPINLGDTGRVYVFDGHASWDCS